MGTLKKWLWSSERAISTATLVFVSLMVSWLGYAYGGYFVGDWALVAFALAALMAVAALAGLLGGARSMWSTAAIGLFVGYAAWTFASISWSPDRGDAWYGSGLTLLYLLAFWVVATLIAMGASRRAALTASAVGPGVVAAVTVLMLGSRTGEIFELSRLMGTVGYFNAAAAFLLVPFWAGIYVASSRRVNPALRSLALAGATLGVEVAVLTQSRGAMVALVVSLPVFFLFSGRRLRGLLALAPVAVFLFIAFSELNTVYTALLDGDQSGAAIERAGGIIWFTTLAAGVYGLVWGLTDRNWRPSRKTTRIAGTAALVAVVALVLVGCFVFVDRVGSPTAWLEGRWEAFKGDEMAVQEDSRFLAAGGSGRYALWEVAWKDFVSNPILGVGTNQYEATYYQERDADIGWVRQPHSLPLEVLAERGVIGGLLFFGFLGVCVAGGLWKRFSALNAEGKAQVGAMLAAVVYWFVHASAEWFWQVPAVTMPAIIYLAMLAAPWNRPRDDEEVFAPSDRPLRLAGVGIAVLAILAIAPLFIADRIEAGADGDNPWVSLRKLERAEAFNPLDADLARREGDLALGIGDIPHASDSYARAISLDPEHYASYAVLGGLYERLGQPERALALYKRALQLNPLDPTLQEDVTRVEGRLSEGTGNQADESGN